MTKPRVLVVDDVPANVKTLAAVLSPEVEVLFATSGPDALAKARQALPELILLDVIMFGMNGHDVCRELKADPKTAEIPVIFVTGMSEAEDEEKGLALGAIDYITKPYQPAIVRARVRNHLSLARLHREIEDHNRTLERRVDERTAELVAAKKMAEIANEAKGRFLASTSHELRTPLNAILGYTELLLEDAHDRADASAESDLRKVRASGRYLLWLINNILDLSKVESNAMDLVTEDVDLVPLVAQALETVGPLMEKSGNRVATDLPEGPVRLTADRAKLQQILLSLLSNAAKFTSAGEIRVALESKEDAVTLTVADTGGGMKPDQLARLFRFFSPGDSSMTRSHGGAGVSLALSRHFARMMLGDITVSSEPGQGSTFVVRLPRGDGR